MPAPVGSAEPRRPGEQMCARPARAPPAAGPPRRTGTAGPAGESRRGCRLAAIPGRVQRLGPQSVAQRKVVVIRARVGEATAERLQHLRQRVADLDRQGQQPADRVLQHHDRIGDLAAGMPVGLHQLRPLEMEQQRHRLLGQVRLLRPPAERRTAAPLLLGVDVGLQAELVVPLGLRLVVAVDLVQQIRRSS